MRTLFPIFLCTLASTSWLPAPEADQAQETVTQAAQSILQQPSYSWISLSESAPGTLTWRQGPTKGQTEKDGATLVSFTFEDNTISIAFKDGKGAINWADEWRAAAELTGDVAWIADRLMTYKRAAEEALFLAGNSDGLKPDADGVFNGQLNHKALQFILSRGRQVTNDPKEMKGTVKFWLKDGRLDKYAYRIEGPISLMPDEPKSPIDRTTTITFKKLGETTVSLPPEAAEKLR